ncbi:MAG: helix-turn-helix domain-containing protein [Romboutsia timonensis]
MNLEIANRLQKLRKEKGYSQEQLAEELGISRQAVSKWERAESSPDTDNLICLAKLYGVSLDELLDTEQTVQEIKEEKLDEKKKEDNFIIRHERISFCDDEGNTVSIGNGGISLYSSEDNSSVQICGEYIPKKRSKAFSIVKDTLGGIFFFGIIIAYIVLGCLYNLWHPAWILFLFIPIIGSIFDVIEHKSLKSFFYPGLVTAIYLFLGIQYNLWHPYWFLFITIPVYYILAEMIDKLLHIKDMDIVYNGEKMDLDDFLDQKEEIQRRYSNGHLNIKIDKDNNCIKIDEAE